VRKKTGILVALLLTGVIAFSAAIIMTTTNNTSNQSTNPGLSSADYQISGDKNSTKAMDETIQVVYSLSNLGSQNTIE
jgi:hypothetical protein